MISVRRKAFDPPLCPSGGAAQEDAEIFAIVGAQEDGVAAYLDRSVKMDDEARALVAPLSPANIYRVAVPCAEQGCAHFEGGACQIAIRLTEQFAPRLAELPRCAIRPACRWWRQEGAEACTRCPEVATTPVAPCDADMIVAGEAGGGTKS